MAGVGSRAAARVAAWTTDARRRVLPRRTTARRRTVVSAAAALVVAFPLVVAATLGDGHSLRVLVEVAGTAWVVSPLQGLVTLMDGATGDVVAGVRTTGRALGVVQGTAAAFLVDGEAGSVAGLDVARYGIGPAVALGTPGTAPLVLQNDPADGRPHVVQVVDPAARTASRVDPVTLRVRAEVALGTHPAPGQAVVDAAGDLWVVDAAGGGLVRVAAPPAGTRTVHRTRAATATAVLVTVRGAAVVVDAARGAVHEVRADGRPGPARCLGTRPGDDVQVIGSTTRDEVYVAVAGTRSLLTASTRADDCGRAVDLTVPGPAPVYGPLAVSGRYVFVPDRTTGTAAVVDTTAGRLVGHVPLTDAGHRVELVAHDGFVFYNDLDGPTAGVLTLVGGAWVPRAHAKYDAGTGEGAEVVVPPAATPAPGGPAPTTAPRAAPRATARPAPEPSSPSPAAPHIVSLTTDAADDARPSYVQHTAAVVTAQVEDVAADARWSWSVISTSGQAPSPTTGGANPLQVADVGGPGSVTVTLTVTQASGTTTATRTFGVTAGPCRLTLGAGDVDVTAGAGTVEVRAEDCPGDAALEVAAPAWLRVDGPTSVGAAGADLTFTVVGEPQGDDLDDLRLVAPGAVTLRALGDGSVTALDVIADAPPRILSAEDCIAAEHINHGPVIAYYTHFVMVEALDDAAAAPALMMTVDPPFGEFNRWVYGGRTHLQIAGQVPPPTDGTVPPPATSVTVTAPDGRSVTSPLQVVGGCSDA